MGFKKPVWGARKVKMALMGVSGSGKTYTALLLASALGKKVAVIDTESRSSVLYAHDPVYRPDGFVFESEFLETFEPEIFVGLIKEAEKEGYDVLIIDSISHEWIGAGGALQQVDRITAKKKLPSNYMAWGEVTPRHDAFIRAITDAKLHVICTIRSKTKYETGDQPGKLRPVAVGLGAVQRDGVEYEYDLIAEMDRSHTLVFLKTRYRELDDTIVRCPDKEFAEKFASIVLRNTHPTSKKPEPRTTTPDPEPVPEEEAPNRVSWAMHPENAAPEIRKLMDKLPQVLTVLNPELSPEGLEFARFRCCSNFDVGSMDEIPADKAQTLKDFMNSELLLDLRKQGYLPARKGESQ